jgi:hypothetical protein
MGSVPHNPSRIINRPGMAESQGMAYLMFDGGQIGMLGDKRSESVSMVEVAVGVSTDEQGDGAD